MRHSSPTIGSNHYDSHSYGGYGSLRTGKDKVLGNTAGVFHPMGDIYNTDFTSNDHEECQDTDLEDEDFPEKVALKINQMTNPLSVKNDFGANKAKDTRTMTKNQAVLEQHTNAATKGISPQIGKSKMMSMTGVTRKFDGPSIGAGQADQAFKTTGNYFYTGTQYGTSRKPLPKKDEDLDPVFNSYDLFDDDRIENNYLKHQNRVNRILKSIEEE